MRRSTGALLAMLSGSAWCTAQVLTATAAAGSVPVSCTYGPTNFIPLGTDLTNGGTVTTLGNGPLGTTRATTTFQPLSITPYEVRAALVTDVAASANAPLSNLMATCGVFLTQPLGRNDVLLRLHATQAVRGRFQIAYSGSSDWQVATVYWVDVHDDGVFESSNFVPTQPLTPVNFGPGTLDVRISNYAGGALNAEHWSFAEIGLLDVHFVPDSRCSATVVAPPCGPIRLQTRQNFTMGSDQHVSQLQPPGSSVAAIVYGFAPANTPLPLPPGCTLTNDAFATRLLLQDASGQAMHSIRTVPLTMRPMRIFAQVLELDVAQGTVQTSESVRIDCN